MLKKSLLGISFALLTVMPAANAGISVSKIKWSKVLASAIIFGACYRTINKGPQTRCIDTRQFGLNEKDAEKVNNALLFVDDTILGSVGDITKGIPATGLLGNIIAQWKAIVAPVLILDQLQTKGPIMLNFLKDMFGIESQKIVEATIKTA